MTAAFWIRRGYCPTCNRHAVLVVSAAGLHEPLTCSRGHSVEVGVAGPDNCRHAGEEAGDLDEPGYGAGV